MAGSVDELIDKWERQYMEFLRAASHSIEADADYWRWQGHATRLRDCLTDLHETLARPVPAYRSKEWRKANGGIS